jgi:hypothetical protein
MSDFERDRFIFVLTRKQLLEYREEGYMNYLYMRFQEIRGVDDSDVQTFYNFLNKKYDSLTDAEFQSYKVTIQHCIWTVSDNNKDDWGYNSFKQAHREKQIKDLL